MKITKITYIGKDVYDLTLNDLNDAIVTNYLYPLGFILGEYMPKDINGKYIDEIIAENFSIEVDNYYIINISYDNFFKRTIIKYSPKLIDNNFEVNDYEIICDKPNMIKSLICKKLPFFIDLYKYLNNYKSIINN